MPDLPSGRISPSLIVFRQKLYCIAGIGEDSSIYSLNLLNPEEWHIYRGNLPRLASMGCVEFDDQIFLFGGVNEVDQMQSTAYFIELDD